MNKNQSHFITKAWTWRGEKALTGRNERQIGHNRPMSSKPPTRPDWKLLRIPVIVTADSGAT
jgi:hypothetical protein